MDVGAPYEVVSDATLKGSPTSGGFIPSRGTVSSFLLFLCIDFCY